LSDIESQDERAGFWFALTAYGSWGVIPVYFKLVAFATPIEIIAHRVHWVALVIFSVEGLYHQRKVTATGG